MDDFIKDYRSLELILTKQEKMQVSYFITKYKNEPHFLNIVLQYYLEDINFEERLNEYLKDKWLVRFIFKLISRSK